jgi:hypothetical protein
VAVAQQTGVAIGADQIPGAAALRAAPGDDRDDRRDPITGELG